MKPTAVKYPWVVGALLLAATYWALAALLHAFVSGQSRFPETPYSLEPTEWWIRVLVLVTLLAGWFFTQTGVSRQRRAAAALRQSEQRYAIAAAAANAAVWEIDCRTDNRYRSEHYFSMLGYKELDIPSTLEGAMNLVHPEDREQQRDVIESAVAGEVSSAHSEHRMLRKDGTYAWVMMDAQVLRDQHGTPLKVIGAMTDISDRKEAEQALVEAAKLKDEFIANMSHELRTPLNAIIGLSDVLINELFGSINADQRESLHMINDGGQHLLDLINDILDLSKIEADRLELQLQDLNPVTVAEAAIRMVDSPAQSRGISIEANRDPTSPAIAADRRRILQILVNLLANAIKFNQREGQVGLDLTHKTGVVSFTIWDSGIGIAKSDLPRLFEAFTQIDSSLDRQFEGTGLGLSLVQHLTELHGGEISVQSDLGSGSRFTVTFPAIGGDAASEPAPAEPVAAADQLATPGIGDGTSLLIVEDNAVNARMTEKILQASGFQTDLVEDAEAALRLLESRTPDIILTDIQLPGMDGLELIRQIRGHPRLANLPIVAITALAMPGDRERCPEAGADEYRPKPLNYPELERLIAELVAASN